MKVYLEVLHIEGDVIIHPISEYRHAHGRMTLGNAIGIEHCADELPLMTSRSFIRVKEDQIVSLRLEWHLFSNLSDG